MSRAVRRCEQAEVEVFSSALISNLLETVAGAPLSTFPVLDVACYILYKQYFFRNSECNTVDTFH